MLQRQQDEMALKITAQDLEISQLKARVKVLEDREGGVSVAKVPTGSGSIPTASAPAREAEIARIHAEEELQIMIDGLDRNNETVAKYLKEYHQFAAELPIGRRIELISDLVKYQDNYAKVLKYQTQQRKPLLKKQQREF
nr:hypothetical protein [Tanacetum cinerariifolium]